MKRAASYGRFSTDRQNGRSIADQHALNGETAARFQFAMALRFDDPELSGASILTRPGILALLDAARSGRFDVLLVEDLDRLSRSQADYHAIRRELDFLGIEIYTPSGPISPIEGTLRALNAEMQLGNTADKVRRGLRGVLRDGRHPGGRAYGYRAVPGKPGELQIVEEEAAVVRRIFAAYAAGITPRRIAGALNAEGVRPCRAQSWMASAINGNYARKSGMLLNELYIGRIVWNRLRMPKNPATGKRVARLNPEGSAVTVAAPHLRIVSDELWSAAQAMKAAKHHAAGPKARAPRRLLSGLVKCGVCGSGMTTHGRDKKGARLQCSAHRERGTCANARMLYRDDVERGAIAALRAAMADPAYLAAFVDEYNAERKRLARSADADRSRQERRLSEVEREIARGVDAILKGRVDPATLASPLRGLEAEKAELARAIGETKEMGTVALHPAALDRYKAGLERMAALVGQDGLSAADGELADALRALVTAVVVTPQARGEPAALEIRGRLSELTGDRPRFGGGMVVAGVRNTHSPTEADVFIIRARAA